jgi:hypothetical protein
MGRIRNDRGGIFWGLGIKEDVGVLLPLRGIWPAGGLRGMRQ